jgi:hypothetical protein
VTYPSEGTRSLLDSPAVATGGVCQAGRDSAHSACEEIGLIPSRIRFDLGRAPPLRLVDICGNGPDSSMSLVARNGNRPHVEPSFPVQTC